MVSVPQREFNCLLLKDGKADAYNTYSLAQKGYETRAKAYIKGGRKGSDSDVIFLVEQANICYQILVNICKERGMFCDEKATRSIQQIRGELGRYLNPGEDA